MKAEVRAVVERVAATVVVAKAAEVKVVVRVEAAKVVAARVVVRVAVAMAVAMAAGGMAAAEMAAAWGLLARWRVCCCHSGTTSHRSWTWLPRCPASRE